MIKNRLLFAILLSSIIFLLALTGCGEGGGGINSRTNHGRSITLMWNAPTTNEDGSPLVDLAGYKVYYGTSSRNYVNSIYVGNNTGTEFVLKRGTWYFAVSAFDIFGNESDYSKEVIKTIIF